MYRQFSSGVIKKNYNNIKTIKKTSYWNIDIRKDTNNKNIYFKLDDITRLLNLKQQYITNFYIPKEDYVKIEIEHGEKLFITHIGLIRILMNYKKDTINYYNIKKMAFDIIFKL